MNEYILKRIPKSQFNRHKRDYGYYIRPYYKKGHGLFYQMNNPPDGYRYYKIVSSKNIFIVGSNFYDELKKAGFI